MEQNQITSYSKLSSMPDYFLENYIFPYLKTSEIFYVLRCVSVDFFNYSNNTMQVNFNTEMITHLNRIFMMNKNKMLTYKFDEESKRMLNEKTVLLLYSLQIHQGLCFQNVLDRLNAQNDTIKKLLLLFFKLTKDNFFIGLINNPSMYTTLRQVMNINENWNNFRTQLNNLLDNDYMDNEYDEILQEYRALDNEYINSLGNDATLIYAFLGKLLEHQESKERLIILKQQVDLLVNAITETTNQWPKQKEFFEKAMQLVEESVSSNRIVNKMLRMFAKYDIDSPLSDYYDIKVTDNKISDFQCILNNRKQLKLLMERVKAMYDIIYTTYDKRSDKCKINKVEIDLGHVLYYMNLIKPEIDISIESIIQMKILFKKYAYMIMNNP